MEPLTNAQSTQPAITQNSKHCHTITKASAATEPGHDGGACPPEPSANNFRASKHLAGGTMQPSEPHFHDTPPLTDATNTVTTATKAAQQLHTWDPDKPLRCLMQRDAPSSRNRRCADMEQNQANAKHEHIPHNREQRVQLVACPFACSSRQPCSTLLTASRPETSHRATSSNLPHKYSTLEVLQALELYRDAPGE